MRSSLIRFAIAGLASLALATSADAAQILSFSQPNSLDFVRASVSGSTTTLTTVGVSNPLFPGSIPITVSQAGVLQGITANAFETFSGPLAATGGGTSSGATSMQTGYAGTVTFSQVAPGAPTVLVPFLTVTFSGASVFGSTGGNSATFSASQPPDTVTLTPNAVAPLGGAIAALIGANPQPGAFAIGFSNLLPSLTLSGATIANFTAQNAGTVSTAIPEPASAVMASTAVLAGLGCFGWRRFKVSQA